MAVKKRENSVEKNEIFLTHFSLQKKKKKTTKENGWMGRREENI